MRHPALVQFLVLALSSALGGADVLPVQPLGGAAGAGRLASQQPGAGPTASPTATPTATPTQAVDLSRNPGSAAPAVVLVTPTVTPTTTPSPVPSPVVTVDLSALGDSSASGGPQAPGAPSGVFQMLTLSGQAPQAVVRLRWRAAEPGTHLVKGYRLFRSTDPGMVEERPAPKAGLWGLGGDDPAVLGSRYEYVVVGVDSQGRLGARSQPGIVDLAAVPAERLAPPAPEGLQAQSQRDQVSLSWKAAPDWFAPVTAYRIYQGLQPPAPGAEAVTQVAEARFAAQPAEKAKDYYYSVAAVDAQGRSSAWSLTVTGRATGTLPPGAPQGLTTRSRTEKVSLEWQAASEGTAVITAYDLARREEGAEAWMSVAQLGATATAYTDSVPGDQGYLYRLRAVDVEGNTGAPAFVGASPSAKLWNKTAILTLPTAYANKKYGDSGVNQNVLFDFYIGSLYEAYDNPYTNQAKTGVFQPLQIGTVTSDTKWALLDDRGLIPGIAAGLYVSALINFGQPSAGQSVGVSSNTGGISTLGNAYAVISKRFWPGEPRAMLHAGLLYGKLADYLTSDPMPESWRPTIRHLTPGGDYPSLFSRFVDPKLNAVVAQAPHMAFAGIQFPFTVPLGFTRWRTGLRVEAMVPLAWDAEYAPTASLPPGAAPPQDSLPWMLNVHLDNLPLFPFDFGLLQYRGGYQVVAFYHIPDLTWTW